MPLIRTHPINRTRITIGNKIDKTKTQPGTQEARRWEWGFGEWVIVPIPPDSRRFALRGVSGLIHALFCYCFKYTCLNVVIYLPVELSCWS
jgi:hypothetical protein